MSNEVRLLGEWRMLSEEDREHLLPHMLMEMRGWRTWSSDPRGREMWLEHTFEKAVVPYFGGEEEAADDEEGPRGLAY